MIWKVLLWKILPSKDWTKGLWTRTLVEGKPVQRKLWWSFWKVCFIHQNGVLHISLVPCDKAYVQIEAKCMEGISLAKTFKLPRWKCYKISISHFSFRSSIYEILREFGKQESSLWISWGEVEKTLASWVLSKLRRGFLYRWTCTPHKTIVNADLEFSQTE